MTNKLLICLGLFLIILCLGYVALSKKNNIIEGIDGKWKSVDPRATDEWCQGNCDREDKNPVCSTWCRQGSASPAAPPKSISWSDVLYETSGVDVGKDAFNAAFWASDGIVKRTCSSCVSTHSVIYYKRLTNIKTFDAYSNMIVTWSDKDNVLETDFNLYGSESDMLANRNQWKFCNYGDPGVAFARDCGASGPVGGQWNSKTKGGRAVKFFVSKNPLTKPKPPAPPPAPPPVAPKPIPLPAPPQPMAKPPITKPIPAPAIHNDDQFTYCPKDGCVPPSAEEGNCSAEIYQVTEDGAITYFKLCSYDCPDVNSLCQGRESNCSKYKCLIRIANGKYNVANTFMSRDAMVNQLGHPICENLECYNPDANDQPRMSQRQFNKMWNKSHHAHHNHHSGNTEDLPSADTYPIYSETQLPNDSSYWHGGNHPDAGAATNLNKKSLKQCNCSYVGAATTLYPDAIEK